MTEADARQLIEDETQWQAQPALSESDVDRLLARAQVIDPAGRVPTDDDYDATYTADSVRRSIATGWRMKAGKAIGVGDVRVGDVQVSGSAAAKFCMDMARTYSNATGVASLAGYTALWETT